MGQCGPTASKTFHAPMQLSPPIRVNYFTLAPHHADWNGVDLFLFDEMTKKALSGTVPLPTLVRNRTVFSHLQYIAPIYRILKSRQTKLLTAQQPAVNYFSHAAVNYFLLSHLSLRLVFRDLTFFQFQQGPTASDWWNDKSTLVKFHVGGPSQGHFSQWRRYLWPSPFSGVAEFWIQIQSILFW